MHKVAYDNPLSNNKSAGPSNILLKDLADYLYCYDVYPFSQPYLATLYIGMKGMMRGVFLMYA